MSYTWLQFKDQVKLLLTDMVPSDDNAAMAASLYVRAQMATQDGDLPGAQFLQKAFQSDKRKLIGWTVGLNAAAFKTAVTKVITDVQPNDDTYVRALADWVKAIAARDLAHDQAGYQANMLIYRNQRKKMVGYTTASNDATIKTAVKKLLTDATVNDTTAIRAVADFVKAKITLEVQHDLAMHDKYWANWISQRSRLLGYQITVNAAAVRTAVNKLITVDANRQGIAATGEFIDVQIEQATIDVFSLDSWVDATILSGKADVRSFNDFYDGMLNIARREIEEPATLIDKLIRQSVIELQEFIELYRRGHETVYMAEDLAEDGESSVGQLPEQAQVEDAFYVQIGAPCARNPLKPWEWGNRFDLVCGSPRIYSGQFAISIEPKGHEFRVFPKVLEGYSVEVFWDGLKLDFADGDQTPFDEGMADAVAEKVLAEMSKRDENRLLSQSHLETYGRKRLSLYREAKSRVRVRETKASSVDGSRESSWRQPCAVTVPDDTFIEVVLFGDSGEVPLDNTIAVASLVKQLRPDFIIHLGDTNYPAGAIINFQENLVRPYAAYIPDKWYQAWGEHDLETEADGQWGKPLLNLLPPIALLNSGKLYYQFTKGEVTFFVTNSGYSDADAREPDGISSGSVQGAWLAAALAASSSTWNIVIMHKPGYTSDINYTPGIVTSRWPFVGAHLVISGHGHNYERGLVPDSLLPWIVAGMGGAAKTNFGAVTYGSQFRYNDAYGALRLSANKDTLRTVFYNINGDPIDTLTLKAAE